MKHSNLYLGLVLPSGGWQSLIGQTLRLKKTKETKEERNALAYYTAQLQIAGKKYKALVP